MADKILTIVALWFASNALLFAWLAYGRYMKWSDIFHFREGHRLR